MYLFGFFDSIPSSKYAKQYFGREALFHSIIMVACGLYIQYGNREVKVARHKIITAYLGKKEMSIQSKDIDWVEVDDHYLKIHGVMCFFRKQTQKIILLSPFLKVNLRSSF